MCCDASNVLVLGGLKSLSLLIIQFHGELCKHDMHVGVDLK